MLMNFVDVVSIKKAQRTRFADAGASLPSALSFFYPPRSQQWVILGKIVARFCCQGATDMGQRAFGGAAGAARLQAGQIG